jgi:uncharacterized protein (TIGR03083 family)
LGSSGKVQPILTADRFAPLRARLLDLLTGFSAEDWARPTAARGWSVKDVAAHLLGGDVGILSRERDHFVASASVIHTHDQLIALVNRLNDEWVTAARRMSPRVLCDLLAWMGPRVEAYFSSLDPMAIGGPVSWAGPEPAPVWFDLARELTERWHHQQQMRDATRRPPLYDPYFLAPVLDTFVRALPYNFRQTSAPSGTIVRLEISGDAGGVWFVRRASESWELATDVDALPSAEVTLPQDVAWRLFTKGFDRQKARQLSVVDGDADLASPIFATTAIIG